MASVYPAFSQHPAPRRRRGFDWRFLALALALHAGLLLLPALRESATVAPARTVELWLRQDPIRAAEVSAPEDRASPPETEPVDVVSPTRRDPLPTRREPPPEAHRDAVEPPRRIPDARHIIDSVGQLHWPEPERGGAPIARVRDDSGYERLSRPLLPELDNLFNGMVLPATAKVVDRWLAPGGVHHVVVRLPNGMTVCGRQEEVSDFRPWEQMPMMFHTCGGGGRK